MDDEVKPACDPEQVAMDLEDARARLLAVALAVEAKQEAEQAVDRCRRELRQAQRRLEECNLNLAYRCHRAKGVAS